LPNYSADQNLFSRKKKKKKKEKKKGEERKKAVEEVAFSVVHVPGERGKKKGEGKGEKKKRGGRFRGNPSGIANTKKKKKK